MIIIKRKYTNFFEYSKKSYGQKKEILKVNLFFFKNVVFLLKKKTKNVPSEISFENDSKLNVISTIVHYRNRLFC